MLYFFALFSQAYSSHPNIYYRAFCYRGSFKMHMADALLSPAVGLGMWALSTGSIAVSTAKIKGSMSIVGVTQNGNTGWSGVKLLHF